MGEGWPTAPSLFVLSSFWLLIQEQKFNFVRFHCTKCKHSRCMDIYMYIICVCVYVCVYIYMCAYIYLYIRVCMYIYLIFLKLKPGVRSSDSGQLTVVTEWPLGCVCPSACVPHLLGTSFPPFIGSPSLSPSGLKALKCNNIQARVCLPLVFSTRNSVSNTCFQSYAPFLKSYYISSFSHFAVSL